LIADDKREGDAGVHGEFDLGVVEDVADLGRE
jgi:hypothetical protein